MKESQLLKSQVLQKLIKACETLDLPSWNSAKIRIEYSRDEKFGDYSSPIALENKNLWKQNPIEIANQLLPFLKEDPMFQEVSVTPPGFLNFRIANEFLKTYVLEVFSDANHFAKLDAPEKILLEFISANPTGPLNIVSARAGAVGDSLARLLKTLGHEVTKEFYVNDYGNQVDLLGVALMFRIRELDGEASRYQNDGEILSLDECIEKNILPLESYRGEYMIPMAKDFQTKFAEELESIRNSKSWKANIPRFSKFAVEWNLSQQKEDLQIFKISFDSFFQESTLHEKNLVLDSLKRFSSSEFVFVEKKKTFFKSTAFGDEKDRVIVRDDKRPTYYLADIAYHLTKIDRGFTRIYDLWGPDHHGYIPRMKGAMTALGYPEASFKVFIIQQVNLLENGVKVKMSKRLGVYQTMKDLLEYLGTSGTDVARYFFLMRSSDSPLDFDLDLAKEESDKNPVYYIQYANARIQSIFREVSKEWNQDAFMELPMDWERNRLLFLVSRFSEEVFDASTTMEPHRLANYLQALAKVFTKFYSSKENRVKDASPTIQRGLLQLLQYNTIAFQKGLELLGISAPEKMVKE